MSIGNNKNGYHVIAIVMIKTLGEMKWCVCVQIAG